jgi:hypothetical protein
MAAIEMAAIEMAAIDMAAIKKGSANVAIALELCLLPSITRLLGAAR